VIEHSSGNLVVAGTVEAAGVSDVFATATDAMGVVKWSKTYGGTSHDYGSDMIENSVDQGLVILGHTRNFGAASYDIMLIKTDSSGVEQWTKVFGTSSSDYAKSISECNLSNDGFIITTSNSVIKTTALGVVIWSKAISITLCTITQVPGADIGYVVGGWYHDGTYWKQLAIMLNSGGSKLWARAYGNNGQDQGGSIISHSIDSHLVIGCDSGTASGQWRLAIMKIDPSAGGAEVWTKTYGPSQQKLEGSKTHTIAEMPDAGFVIVGKWSLFMVTHNWDVLLIKTDSAGVLEWAKSFSAAGGTFGRSITARADGSIALVGLIDSLGAGGIDVMLIVQPGMFVCMYVCTYVCVCLYMYVIMWSAQRH
jgi:hypothetical protein